MVIIINFKDENGGIIHVRLRQGDVVRNRAIIFHLKQSPRERMREVRRFLPFLRCQTIFCGC